MKIGFRGVGQNMRMLSGSYFDMSLLLLWVCYVRTKLNKIGAFSLVRVWFSVVRRGRSRIRSRASIVVVRGQII